MFHHSNISCDLALEPSNSWHDCTKEVPQYMFLLRNRKRALDKSEYLVILFLISHQNLML